jgi:predicted adenylyl cyclase CyaB
MPVNLELKARIRSCAEARARAESGGAHFQGILRQLDTYFHVRRGRLKLREHAQGPAELIHYERAEDSLERWSNYRTIPVADPGAMKAALSEALGILAEVRKERTLFLYRGARIHLDRVEGLGEYIEFEVPAGVEGETAGIMRELRGIFGVADDAIEKHSYSDIILEGSSGS